MSPRGLRPFLALAALLAALVFSGTGQAKPGCASALLNDWRDGRIDGTYSVDCYRIARAQPADPGSAGESSKAEAIGRQRRRRVATPGVGGRRRDSRGDGLRLRARALGQA